MGFSAFTCDNSLERTARDVRLSSVLDGDQIIARSRGCVREFIAVIDFHAVELHFGWTVDGDGQSSGAGVLCVDNELALLARLSGGQSRSVSPDHSGVGVLLADHYSEGTAWDVAAVQPHMDVVEAVLTGHKPNSIPILKMHTNKR